MKILLVAPASGKWKEAAQTKLFTGKTFRFSLLSLLSVAAETPKEVKVEIVDEQIGAIPWRADFDLVGITCMTALAPRAYEIAARFRQQNIPVVLGGMHPTLCPEDAIPHADAIVVGDAEGIWGQVISDLKKGTLHKIYANDRQPDMAGLKKVPRSLLAKNSYATINAVQATRGCPNACEFCAVSAFHRQTQRRRPVKEVISEISGLPNKFVLFVDDNLTADRGYAARLFKGLVPLKKIWGAQSTIAIAEDPSLVRLAAESGCIGLFIGIETFSRENLSGVGKTCNRVEKYREAIRQFHSFGIAVEAGIVFGFDNDHPTVFQNTLRVLDKLKIDLIQASIFTPLPGTMSFGTMQQRIFDRDWNNYDFHSVVFQPKHMSPADLQGGHDWVTRRFYEPHRIARRLWHHAKRPRSLASMGYVAALNLAYYGRVLNWNIRGFNPAKRNGPLARYSTLENTEFLRSVQVN
jgi:radical SAM superfamily enzyme YgiQ (UPF0313 family)